MFQKHRAEHELASKHNEKVTKTKTMSLNQQKQSAMNDGWSAEYTG